MSRKGFTMPFMIQLPLKTNFYIYKNQIVEAANIDQAKFDTTLSYVFIIPGGNQTFWTELRDSRKTAYLRAMLMLVQKQIASTSDYSPYGWHSDNYTLISKNDSELFIMSPKTPGKQLKITDFYKPAQTYPGYGYRYGRY